MLRRRRCLHALPRPGAPTLPPVSAGVYQSWQCSTDFPGAYQALINLSTTAADGTKTQKVGRLPERGVPGRVAWCRADAVVFPRSAEAAFASWCTPFSAPALCHATCSSNRPSACAAARTPHTCTSSPRLQTVCELGIYSGPGYVSSAPARTVSTSRLPSSVAQCAWWYAWLHQLGATPLLLPAGRPPQLTMPACPAPVLTAAAGHCPERERVPHHARVLGGPAQVRPGSGVGCASIHLLLLPAAAMWRGCCAVH